MLIDDDVATVGTANFDNRSFRLNFEVTALVAAVGLLIVLVAAGLSMRFTGRVVP